MMEEVKLMGALPSLYSCRVEWALTLKGIKYEYIEEDLLNKSSLLLKHNPIHKKVPLMLHGGKSIAESLIILEYMEETWKQNPLLPQDPLEKANARFWAKFADEKVAFPMWTAFLLKGQEQEKAMETPLQALKSLDEDLKGKKFFGGKSIGLVDLVVGWIPHWVPVIEKVLGLKLLGADSFPSLYAWTERFLNVPFIREKLPPSDRLLAFYTTIRKELLNK
ncbi:hypothetical protein AAC387_Pa02g4584 [Persea americana]